MKKSIFHIFLTFILTFAVTEYVWIELLGNDQIVAEIETEKETEEEVREGRSTDSKPDLFDNDFTSTESYLVKHPLKSITSQGELLRSIVKRNSPKLFLLHGQLRLDC